MTETKSLANHFLIAMPSLQDPNFSQTVTYVCEHSAAGAMGIVINRPLRLTVGEVLEHMQITPGEHVDVEHDVLMGGPVQGEHGFVLHTPPGKWSSSVRITDRIAVTTSRDILAAIAEGRGPERYLLALGYAGWGAGQLEREMAENAWLSGPADPRILFELPLEERWRAAAALIGIDLNLLSTEVGHA
ncbi:MAG: YqgE/AlgH family protein [Thiohalomonadaceae bacterium]